MTRPGRLKDITSLANDDIKAIKALQMKKARARDGLFIAEGLKLALDALDAGWPMARLVVAKASLSEKGVEKAVQRALAKGIDVLTVPLKALEAITRRDNAQNVVSILETRFAGMDAIPFGKPGDTLVALDRVRDPGNLGTIIRSADAAGAAGVVLVGDCVDLFSLEAVRATMGSLFALPIARAEPDALFALARDRGAQVIGSHLAGATDYRAIGYAGRPTILFMGNEQAGLPDDIAARCDRLAKIPQVGRADSLNLAVATALMLYEARRDLLMPGAEA